MATLFANNIPKVSSILLLLCGSLQFTHSVYLDQSTQASEKGVLNSPAYDSSALGDSSSEEDEQECETTRGDDTINRTKFEGEELFDDDYKGNAFECGKAPLNDLATSYKTRYIIDGQKQIYGEWPSFVGIGLLDRKGSLSCGGVIINRRQVLTSAFCVHNHAEHRRMYNTSNLVVVTGLHRLGRFNTYSKLHRVENICSTNATWNGWTYTKDYAVLTLKQEIQFNDYVQPACLPGQNGNQVNLRGQCFVIGHGAKRIHYKKSAGENGKTFFPLVVQKLQVKEQVCDSVWKIPEDDNGQICFNRKENPEKMVSTCDEDDGSPLLCLSMENRWTVVGLVALIPEKCVGSQTVFTNVGLLVGEMRRVCKLRI